MLVPKHRIPATVRRSHALYDVRRTMNDHCLVPIENRAERERTVGLVLDEVVKHWGILRHNKRFRMIVRNKLWELHEEGWKGSIGYVIQLFPCEELWWYA